MHLSRQQRSDAAPLARQEPLYRELAAVLRRELEQFSAGDYLPAEIQLAARFSVNRHTLRRAVDELVLEGLLLRRQGKGTQVLARPLIYPMEAGSAYSDSLSALGQRVEAQLLERRVRSATAEECQYLQLADDSELLELTTLRLLQGQPVSLIRHRFCASHAALLADYRGGSLRQYLAERELLLSRSFSLIGARLPGREEAAHLLMPRHAPLLTVLTLSRDTAGRPLELSFSTSRADRFQYQITP
ncbi:phosphonate metabolism transcriptional regulator PhnF [Phytopseudomonas dryadis]|uniref:Phosphonate metabolism transcriptional regulator PhnF n=1 Tax=Phytopseudomonas dryadis TaxID=2487520 RepID=A0ABY1ZB04_9GAMM|nr:MULTISPECIES: phosphonate metabolism transcriptional regulator PhnF [Pseudomonas]TBV07896.1 phosphonate metabolism transcriptional regulator PhnF [Pseudomonas dryadis]TBV19291.1 phosphonate metabolism transcriptional regulator PhnF [Pseudomonas sp. FRB 230]